MSGQRLLPTNVQQKSSISNNDLYLLNRCFTLLTVHDFGYNQYIGNFHHRIAQSIAFPALCFVVSDCNQDLAKRRKQDLLSIRISSVLRRP